MILELRNLGEKIRRKSGFRFLQPVFNIAFLVAHCGGFLMGPNFFSEAKMSAPAVASAATAPVGTVSELASEVVVQADVEATKNDPFSNEPPLSFRPQGAEKRGRNTGYAFPEKAILYCTILLSRFIIKLAVRNSCIAGREEEHLLDGRHRD